MRDMFKQSGVEGCVVHEGPHHLIWYWLDILDDAIRRARAVTYSLAGMTFLTVRVVQFRKKAHAKLVYKLHLSQIRLLAM